MLCDLILEIKCGCAYGDVSVVGLQGVAVRVPVLSLHCMERCDLRMEFKM